MSSDYGRFHRNPTNLVIHIVAVPIFAACMLAAIGSLVMGHFLLGMLLFLGVGLSLALQGYGHKLETIPPESFDGPGNFMRRILAEQFFGFWVFLFSGGWARAFRQQ
jgi:hypothetical protein